MALGHQSDHFDSVSHSTDIFLEPTTYQYDLTLQSSAKQISRDLNKPPRQSSCIYQFCILPLSHFLVLYLDKISPWKIPDESSSALNSLSYLSIGV